MCGPPAKNGGEQGFTLQEALTTVAIMGILAAIGVVIFLTLLERWRVHAATEQLVGDLRLAHTSATNQLTDWRVVLALGRSEQEEGPDYYLVRLRAPYPSSSPVLDGPAKPRFFPGNVRAANVVTASGSVLDNHDDPYWVSPWASPPPAVPETRTLEFNSDGTMTFFQSPSGSSCVTVETLPL